LDFGDFKHSKAIHLHFTCIRDLGPHPSLASL
jgi:hypothetical protein